MTSSAPAPRFVEHCIALYNELDRQARLEDFEGTIQKVFKGSLLQAFKNTGISQSYYTKIYGALKASECIIVASRGGRGAPSVVILLGRPTSEILSELPLTFGPSAAKLGARITELESRLKRLENLLGGLDVKKALIEVDRRLAELPQLAQENDAKEPE